MDSNLNKQAVEKGISIFFQKYKNMHRFYLVYGTGTMVLYKLPYKGIYSKVKAKKKQVAFVNINNKHGRLPSLQVS